MTGFDLAGFLDAPDGEYTASVKGRPLRFELEAPGHIELMESSVLSLDVDRRIRESEPGELPYSFEEVEGLYRYVDAHILRVEGQDWRELDVELRFRTLRKLTAGDFWGLFAAVTACASLPEDKKNG